MTAHGYLATGWRDLPGLALALLVAVALPLLVRDDYYANVLVLILIYAGLASSWNLIGGVAGQFSLGHSAFFGIGAYSSTILYNYFGISPWLGLLVGGAISVVVAALISFPVFRMRGVFFAMATLAVSETIRILLIYARKFVPLPYSISINYEPGFWRMIFEDRASYALLAGGYFLICAAVTFVLTRSYTGYYLRAIRDNEDAADASGIHIRRYKLLAFVVSAFLTSIGGTLMAQYILYIEPGTVFSMELSVDLPLMSILGGIGTVLGPFVGALILIPLRELLVEHLGGTLPGAHLVLYGLLLILIVILLPHGLLGGLVRFGAMLRGRRPAARPEVRKA
jgi:branched-chain amino acid transport system permease protein